jgi:ABC-type branched-subunit amino acid transport system substrate-binding protein
MLPVVAIGCGSDDDSSGGGGSTAKETNIGVLIPLTGELGAFGKPWQQAADLAIEEANATGALPGGTKLKAVVADDETNPETAVEAARRMIGTQNVASIIGPTSGEMLALAPVAKRSRIPIISSSAGTVGLNKIGGDYLFRTITSDDAEGPALAKFLSDEKATRVGIFVANDASPISVGTKLKSSFEAHGGKVVHDEKVNLNQSSYRAEVGTMLSKKPEWIVCACGQQAGTTILKDLVSAGYKGRRIITGDLTTPEAIEAVGAKDMEGANGELAGADPESPGAKKFDAAWQKKYGAEPGPYSSNTYDAMALSILAMIAADSTDGQKTAAKIKEISTAPGKKVNTIPEAAEALKAGEEIDYDGASGPIDLDDSGTAISSFEIFEAKDGKWETIKFYPAAEVKAFTDEAS